MFYIPPFQVFFIYKKNMIAMQLWFLYFISLIVFFIYFYYVTCNPLTVYFSTTFLALIVQLVAFSQLRFSNLPESGRFSLIVLIFIALFLPLLVIIYIYNLNKIDWNIELY